MLLAFSFGKASKLLPVLNIRTGSWKVRETKERKIAPEYQVKSKFQGRAGPVAPIQ